MSSRRERESAREDHHRRSTRDQPPSKRPPMNEFFVDGAGIDRQVLQSELCRFLGPDAICKPAEYNGIRGYKIKALRPFTSEMLVDLKRLSENFIQESQNHPEDISWEQSVTLQRWNANEYVPGPPGPSGNNRFPPVSSPFGADAPPQFPPNNFQGGPGYPPFSGPSNMGGMPASGRPDDYGHHYAVGERPPPHYQGSYYPPDGGIANAPRTSQPTPGFYSNAGPSQDPRGGSGYYDQPPMGGVMPGPRPEYGMPSRATNGSPYEAPGRDPYPRQPPQDPYRRGDRRGP